VQSRILWILCCPRNAYKLRLYPLLIRNMPIGSRQLVLMTHLAMQWPRRIHSVETKRFRVEDCKHNGRCNCWRDMPTSIISIFDSLNDRGFIDFVMGSKNKKPSKRWQLTPEGWRALHGQTRSPVRVRTWAANGIPLIYTVNRSKRAEFKVLYWKIGWGRMNSWITQNKLALYVLEETT